MRTCQDKSCCTGVESGRSVYSSIGFIFFGATFVLAEYARCTSKPGCTNENFGKIYGGSWVLFFVGWAPFLGGGIFIYGNSRDTVVFSR
jgi:hypothetical protein